MPVTTEIRVRYAETDQMGVVLLCQLFVWFEVGRVEALPRSWLLVQAAGARTPVHLPWSMPLPLPLFSPLRRANSHRNRFGGARARCEVCLPRLAQGIG